MEKFLPLQKEIMHLKSDLSKAHLWLEEAISGDPYIDIQRDVMIPLSHKNFYIYLKVAEISLQEDKKYLNELKRLEKELQKFLSIAKRRWAMSQEYGIGSDLDQEFDRAFTKIINIVDTLDSNIDNKISREIKTRNDYFFYIIGAFLFINIFMFTILFFSRRKQEEYEASLKEEKKRALVTLESIGDAVITTDIEGKVTFFNATARRLTELTNENVIGKYIDDILHISNAETGDKKLTPIQNVINQGVTKLLSNGTMLTSASGQEYIISDSAAPVIDESGNVFGTVFVFQDDTEQHKLQDLLEYRANYDSLTGLPNRELYLDRLKQNISLAKRADTKIAVLFIDLDHFKAINDSLGHYAGDLVIKEVAKRLSSAVRETDTVSRLGGDEFTVILSSINDEAAVVDIVLKLMKAMKPSIVVADQELYVTMSIGISISPDDGNDAQTLLKNSDSAMYKAKDAGRNRYEFYTAKMTELANERLELETALNRAVQNEEFIVMYQPQIDAIGERLIGMEALVRWNHPQKGLLSPLKFIPFAEEIGLISKLDRHIINIALSQYKLWRIQGLNPGVLALNISVSFLEEKGFVDSIMELLEIHEIAPKDIQLEITEGQIMKNPELSISRLELIRERGIKIAVDDFGTGYSSLSYLKFLPIDKLKIDKSFVDHIPTDREDVAIVKAIISLSKGLEVEVIAEGVELKNQMEFLVSCGCHQIQGYYYHKPLSSEDMELKLKESK